MILKLKDAFPSKVNRSAHLRLEVKQENNLNTNELIEKLEKVNLQMADTSKDLEKSPRFYNSLISNCTNELAKDANKVKAHTIPFDIALVFPGYSD